MIKAPFNFVPLSDKVYFPDWADQISHDIPFEDGEDGIITLEITNSTPLFIRDGHKKGEETLWSCHTKDADGKKHYFIPATTLKGCFRNVMEIVSFSKLNLFDNATFGYRSFTTQIKGVNYQQDIAKINSCGWLYKLDNNYYIDECLEGIQKITHSQLKHFFPNFNTGKDHETAEVKQRSLARVLYPTLEVANDQVSYKHNKEVRFVKAGAYKVVCTGYMTRKNVEYLFSERTEQIVVEEDIFKAFDTIHQYTPYYAGRAGKEGVLKGIIKKGGKIPVFFEKKDGKVISMGITRMYKYPFKSSIKDCIQNISKEHFSSKRDLTESVFGYIGKESLKGRVQIGHAHAQAIIYDEDCPTITGVLGQPRPSYYPLYLKQGNNSVANYSSDNARISGRKRYRITKNGEILPLSLGNENEKVQNSIRPIPSNQTFICKIRVHNLKKIEIGALLSAITFNNTENTYHNIGLAKSFGYGAFCCKVKLSEEFKLSANEYINAFNEEISYFLQQNQSRLSNEESLSALVSIASATHSADEMKQMNFDECSLYKEDRNFSVLTEKKKSFHIDIDETSVIKQKLSEKAILDIERFRQLPSDDAIDRLTALKISITGLGLDDLIEKVEDEIEQIRSALMAKAKQEEDERKQKELDKISDNKQRKLNAGLSFLLETKANSDELKISLLSQGVSRINDFLKKNKEYNLTENDVESIQTWLLKLKYPTKKSDVNDFKSFDGKSWKYLAGIVGRETAETWHSKLNQPA